MAEQPAAPSVRDDYPVKITRDLRIGAPQPFYRAIADLLEAHGFRVSQDAAPAMASAALPGTATFHARLTAMRDARAPRTADRGAYGLLGGGIVLVLAILVLVIFGVTDRFVVSALLLPAVVLGGMGLGRLGRAARPVRHLVEVRLEGESYVAGAVRSPAATGTGEESRVERAGVVSDVRATVLAGAGEPEGERGVRGWLPESQDLVFAATAGTTAAPAGPAAPSIRLDAALDAAMARHALAGAPVAPPRISRTNA